MQDPEEDPPIEFNPEQEHNGSLGVGSADDLIDIVENISPEHPTQYENQEI